jgi:Ca2+-binding RTX toxin-like protein
VTQRTFLLAAAAFLLLPGAAVAADVRVDEARVVYEAAAGEVNDVRVTSIDVVDEETVDVSLRDAGAVVTPGDGCQGGTDGAVVCRVALGGSFLITARLGDGDDFFTAARTCGGFVVCVAVEAGAGNDVVIGSGAADQLRGNGGDDTLEGLRGVGWGGFVPTGNELDGGYGDDRLKGGREYDLLVGGPGADVLEGGRGFDTVSYGTRRLPVRVQIDGDADDGAPGERDRVGLDVELVVGGRGHDRLIGDGRANKFDGGPGRDVILGRAGPDFLVGGTGADVVRGGAGRDRLRATWYDPMGHAIPTERRARDLLYGGPDADILDSADDTADRVRGGRGSDRAFIDSRLDRVRGIERVDSPEFAIAARYKGAAAFRAQ